MMRPLMPVYPQITDGYYIRIYIYIIHISKNNAHFSISNITNISETYNYHYTFYRIGLPPFLPSPLDTRSFETGSHASLSIPFRSRE